VSLTYSDPGHRYRLDGASVPNVTTILNGGIPKPALIDWAARTAGEAGAAFLFGDDDEPALLIVERLRTLGREAFAAACAAARHTRNREAQVKGSDVHALAEQVVAGVAVEVPHDLAGYVEGYVQLIDRLHLEPLLVERPVASRRHWYAGRFDLIARIDDVVWLLDVKTGSGIYGETACQTAAYASAEVYVAEDGTEHPLPRVDKIGALHVQPGGTDLYDLGDVHEAFDEFLAARTIYATTRRRAQLVQAPVVLVDTSALF
jgi:hypothetical protein